MTNSLEIHRFDFAGHVLEIEARPGNLGQAFDGMMADLRTDSAAEPAFRIVMEEETPTAAPPGSSLVYQGPIFAEGDCIYSLCGNATHFAYPGELSVLIESDKRIARISVAPGHARRAGQNGGMVAIEAAVDSTGQQVLHAAGLVLPGRDDIVLVHAPSGTGKTTTSLALATTGFALSSDDAMVLRVDGAKASAWGFPRDVKIHRNTAAMLPSVGALLGPKWDDNGEQPAKLSMLAQVVNIATPRPRPVVGIFHLVRHAGSPASIRKLSGAEALVTLASDNVRTGQTGLIPLQQRRYLALARLVSMVPAFEINVGADPAEVGALILQAV